jgi:hypothetical protein
MDRELDVLNRIHSRLVGRSLSSSEKAMLKSKFDVSLLPDVLLDILSNYNIIHQAFSVSEEVDRSGLGVEMEWLTPSNQIEEAYKYYPGILILSEGYLPIGSCLLGSGDPYFLKLVDQKNIVFRAPHDAVFEGGYDYDSIELICELHQLFSNFIEQPKSD